MILMNYVSVNNIRYKISKKLAGNKRFYYFFINFAIKNIASKFGKREMD